MSRNVAMQEALRGADIDWEYVEPSRLELERASDKLIRRAQRDGKMRKDFKACELGMLMGGVCASMGANSPIGTDWRRHLEILIDGLRAKS